MTATELRIVLIVLGALILGAIYWLGRGGSRRLGEQLRARGRREPVIGAENGAVPGFSSLDDEPWNRDLASDELPTIEIDGLSERDERRDSSAPPKVGQREVAPHDRIISLYVVAQDGYTLHGPELVVAAEKAGLVHGDLGIFHRMVDSKPELGPIFSMANMVRPGNFDLAQIEQFSTPGVVVFMTLPGPLSALDCWDTMLPAAQRFSDLLGAQLLDDQRSPLGRQRIAALRDELRAYDRKREQLQIKPGW